MHGLSASLAYEVVFRVEGRNGFDKITPFMCFLCCPNGIWGRFPEESQLRQSRVSNFNLLTSLVYAVFLCDHTTGCEDYSFTTDAYGIFNVRTSLDACHTHEGESLGTSTPAQELTRRDRNTAPHPAPPGIKPRVVGFEFRRTNH